MIFDYLCILKAGHSAAAARLRKVRTGKGTPLRKAQEGAIFRKP